MRKLVLASAALACLALASAPASARVVRELLPVELGNPYTDFFPGYVQPQQAYISTTLCRPTCDSLFFHKHHVVAKKKTVKKTTAKVVAAKISVKARHKVHHVALSHGHPYVRIWYFDGRAVSRPDYFVMVHGP